MNLKNNFHGKYQHNNCPRCLHEPDDEEHLFSSCSQLGSLYWKCYAIMKCLKLPDCREVQRDSI